MFKIVCAGWSCAKWIEQTLDSVRGQSRNDWQVAIAYDGGTDEGDQTIRNIWKTNGRFTGFINEPGEYRGAVHNRHLAASLMNPADDDIVIFLDIDGDMLAHPDVLAHLADYYSDGTLLTYGSYRPIPEDPGCSPAIPFPPEVIAANSYREFIRQGRGTCFNHLRTMSGRVFNAIPVDQFMDGNGNWAQKGVDYMFHVSGLELAGPRHKCIEEVLMTYNHANDKADYLMNPNETNGCVGHFLSKQPLSPLP